MEISIKSRDLEEFVFNYFVSLGKTVMIVKYEYKENITDDGWDFSSFCVNALEVVTVNMLGKTYCTTKFISIGIEELKELLVLENDNYEIMGFHPYKERIVIYIEEKESKLKRKKNENNRVK